MENDIRGQKRNTEQTSNYMLFMFQSLQSHHFYLHWQYSLIPSRPCHWYIYNIYTSKRHGMVDRTKERNVYLSNFICSLSLNFLVQRLALIPNSIIESFFANFSFMFNKWYWTVEERKRSIVKLKWTLIHRSRLLRRYEIFCVILNNALNARV